MQQRCGCQEAPGCCILHGKCGLARCVQAPVKLGVLPASASFTPWHLATCRPLLAKILTIGRTDYWLDYDWDILTHIVTYGANKANMVTLCPSLSPSLCLTRCLSLSHSVSLSKVTYAKARGVKLLQAFSGCEYQHTGNATVRARIVQEALAYAPPPWGKHDANTSFDGLFFDIECTIEPCPYLYPDNVRGQAAFFQELKAAWPAVYTSVYLGGLPGQRISGVAHPNASTPFCQAGPVCAQFLNGLCVNGSDPRLLNCSAAMSSPSHPLGSGCPNCTAPLYYNLEDIAPMVAFVDQFVCECAFSPI